MNILQLLGLKKKSASIAKERLQIVVSHQRMDGGDVDFLPKMRYELLAVISKYVKINQEQINVQLQRNGNCSVLELNIMLPTPVLQENG
jgi:cell division topological specificity factor